ncbi:MAG: hypothetical protein Q4G34_00990 [Micrococcus sp.]|nr:hypothetical protein [Micrococcus sp.]
MEITVAPSGRDAVNGALVCCIAAARRLADELEVEAMSAALQASRLLEEAGADPAVAEESVVEETMTRQPSGRALLTAAAELLDGVGADQRGAMLPARAELAVALSSS